MTRDSQNSDTGIDRRTALKTAGVAGMGLLGGSALTGSAAAKGHKGGGNGGGGPPCFKGFECDEGGTYVKFEFAIDEETGECYFEEETDTGLVEITYWEDKDGTSTDDEADPECEPVYIEWTAEDEETPFVANEVMAFGGKDCDTVEDPEGSYNADRDGDAGLDNNGGQTAAISNLQFCLEEEPDIPGEELPQCPFYGTSREDPTGIFQIEYDGENVNEREVGDIDDTSPSDSNYPNGLAFDPDNDFWYFARKGGVLTTLNENGGLNEKEYESISEGDDIACATFYDGGYYYTPQGGGKLWRADLNGDDVIVDKNVCDLPVDDLTFGDIAIDPDQEIAYFSVEGAFFQVSLSDCTHEIIVQDASPDEFALLRQIAFAEETLWAHNALNGDWHTVDVSDGSLSELIDNTAEYTDIAQCGETNAIDL